MPWHRLPPANLDRAIPGGRLSTRGLSRLRHPFFVTLFMSMHPGAARQLGFTFCCTLQLRRILSSFLGVFASLASPAKLAALLFRPAAFPVSALPEISVKLCQLQAVIQPLLADLSFYIFRGSFFLSLRAESAYQL